MLLSPCEQATDSLHCSNHADWQPATVTYLQHQTQFEEQTNIGGREVGPKAEEHEADTELCGTLHAMCL